MDHGNTKGQQMFHFFTALYEFECYLMEELSALGMATVKKQDLLSGRLGKFGRKNIKMLKSLTENGILIKDIAVKWTF